MNANDTLRDFNCTEHYYRHLFGMLLTDGSKALAERFGLFWFIDIVVSYQPDLSDEEFQVWTLSKYEDSSAIVECTDGNGRRLKQQLVPFTDFKGTTATVWVEGNVILLPSEH